MEDSFRVAVADDGSLGSGPRRILPASTVAARTAAAPRNPGAQDFCGRLIQAARVNDGRHRSILRGWRPDDTCELNLHPRLGRIRHFVANLKREAATVVI